jgi:hypothetical protein
MAREGVRTGDFIDQQLANFTSPAPSPRAPTTWRCKSPCGAKIMSAKLGSTRWIFAQRRARFPNCSSAKCYDVLVTKDVLAIQRSTGEPQQGSVIKDSEKVEPDKQAFNVRHVRMTEQTHLVEFELYRIDPVHHRRSAAQDVELEPLDIDFALAHPSGTAWTQRYRVLAVNGSNEAALARRVSDGLGERVAREPGILAMVGANVEDDRISREYSCEVA